MANTTWVFLSLLLLWCTFAQVRSIPSIETINGTLVFVVPQGTEAMVVFQDPSTGARTAPAQIALLSDLTALQNTLLAQMSNLEGRLNANIQATQSNFTTQLNTITGTQNHLAAQLDTKLTLNSTCQCFDPKSLQAVNTQLSSLQTDSSFHVDTRNLSSIDSEVALVIGRSALTTSVSLLQQQAQFFVDIRNLSLIDIEVSSVIARTVTPQTSALSTAVTALQLQTPFYIDTRNLSVIDNEVSAVISRTVLPQTVSLNSSLASLQRQISTYSVDTRNLSVIDNEVMLVIGRSVFPVTSALNSSFLLYQQQVAASYVAQSQLSVIDGEIVAVVNNMSQPGATNALAALLSTKLNTTQVQAVLAQSLRCGSLPGTLLNGDTSGCVGTLSGLSCSGTCQLGYTVNGNYSCLAGTWSGNSSCVANPCVPNLVAPANGAVSSATGRTGTTSSFSCNTGYSLVGPSTTTCQPSGVWTSSTVSCAPNPCAPNLVAPANGAVSSTTGTTGSVSTFSCNAGFSLVGSTTATCLPSGAWTSSAVNCMANGLSPAGALPGCTASAVSVTGLYYVAIPLSGGGSQTVQVFCRVDADGTKWLMFQRRTDTTDFYQGWTSYVNGFGTVSANNATGTSFWLGLELLYQITRTGTWKLRVDLMDQVSGSSSYETYSSFAIGSASTFYTLSVSGPAGPAGDALTGHNGYPFSTYDADHDTWPSNCAIVSLNNFFLFCNTF